jgi:thioredoxin-related protein
LLINFSLSAGDLKWYSYKEGVELAKKEKKLLLIDFYTDWCGWCKKMDKTVYTDQEVIELLNKYFIAVKLNPEKDDPVTYQGETYEAGQFARATGLKGYPATAFFTSEVEFIYLVPGYQNKDRFLGLLDYFSSGNYTKVGFEDYLIFTEIDKKQKAEPQDADLNFVVGYFYHKILNENEKAESYYKNSVKQNSEFAEAYALLAEVSTGKNSKDYLKEAQKLGYKNEEEVLEKVKSILTTHLN